MDFPDFEVVRGSDRVDFSLMLRAFEDETRSFLESEKYLIYGLTSMLQVREAIELPYRMIPGLTFGPASVVKVPWVEIEPRGPYSTTVVGRLKAYYSHWAPSLMSVTIWTRLCMKVCLMPTSHLNMP
jgi:hypothetical protein